VARVALNDKSESAVNRPVPPRPGQGASAARLAQILRVDHAGELAAVHIYRGQRAVMGGSPALAATAEQLGDMEAQEALHLQAFDGLLNERGVRPSLFTPLWRFAGFALGAGTALLGQEATHACTEAVETVIEQHYAEQIQELAKVEPQLAETLVAFRRDELEHRDHAIEAGARDAPAHGLLSAVIRLGCRAAIKVSEKI